MGFRRRRTDEALDFTYSPFVALYFAVRRQRSSGDNGARSHVRLWAINEKAVNDRFNIIFLNAKREAHLSENRPAPDPIIVNMDPDYFYSPADSVTQEIQDLQKRIAESLAAKGTMRGEFLRNGCAVVAQPPTFNPRLASQEGVFLINCAEELTLCASLNNMMAGNGNDWCRRFDIAIDGIPEIEQRLFQMNIHEQSLFPDLQGLAGFIRQKLRLHWQ